jgi:CPW-WPC domain-containing protein
MDSVTLGGDDDYRLYVSPNLVDVSLHGEGCAYKSEEDFDCGRRFLKGKVQELAPRPYIVWEDGSLWERIAGSSRDSACLPDYSHRCPLLWTEKTSVGNWGMTTECLAPSSYRNAKGSPCAPQAHLAAIGQAEKALWALDCEVVFPCRAAS